MENFNAEKVQAVKKMIEAGKYDASSERIADALIGFSRRLLRAPVSLKKTASYFVVSFNNSEHALNVLRIAS